jgi:hypothetical protein
MQVADLAFGKCNDFHTCESYPLEHAGDILLIAADAVQRLGEHDLKPAAKGSASSAWMPDRISWAPDTARSW